MRQYPRDHRRILDRRQHGHPPFTTRAGEHVERGPDHWGRYRDQLVRVGERWLFASRRVRLDGRAAGSVFA